MHVPCPSVFYAVAVGHVPAKIAVTIAIVVPIADYICPAFGIRRTNPFDDLGRKVNCN
jgi:hypothetical protein